MSSHLSLYLQPLPRYSVLKLESKNYILEKSAFETLETLEMTKTLCRMLHPGNEGKLLFSIVDFLLCVCLC